MPSPVTIRRDLGIRIHGAFFYPPSAFEPRRRYSLLYTGVNRTGFLGDLITWEDGVYGTSKSVFAGGGERARSGWSRSTGRAHASEWAVLQSVAPKLGCTAETLRKWVRQAQRDAGHRPGLS